MPLHPFQAVRFLREGLNVLLPVAAIGGDILGMRLITFWGLSGGLAIASVTVDVTLQASAQAIFTLMGLGLLMRNYGVGSLGILMLGSVAVVVAALLGFQLLQRRGMKPLERLLARILQRNLLRDAEPSSAPLALQAAFTEIWSDHAGIAAAAAMHLGAWLVGILEVWIALSCMGSSRGWEVAAMLESLSQGLRSLAFPVPAGIGVQEGGLIALGQLLGLEPGTALAISMVKRVPDIVLGVPALLSWLGLEARHMAHRRSQQGGEQP
jgi:putative membrane protein